MLAGVRMALEFQDVSYLTTELGERLKPQIANLFKFRVDVACASFRC
jgi:hypothetical protein